MKERTSGFISGVLVTLLLTGFVGTAVLAGYQKQATLNYSGIQVTLDGKKITPTDVDGNAVEPFTISGTTYLPLRAVAGALGLGVTWDATTQTAALTTSGYVPPVQEPVWTSNQVIGSVSYKVPAAWTAAPTSSDQMFFLDSSKDPRKGVLLVTQESSKVNISDKQEVTAFLYGVAAGFSKNDTSCKNLTTGTVSARADNSYSMTFSFELWYSDSGYLPARMIVIAQNDTVTGFVLAVPASYSQTVESCANKLLSSITVAK